MIHVIDEKTDNILAVLSENEFWGDEYLENLKGTETLKFILSSKNPKAESFTARRKIVIPGEDGEFKEFILNEPYLINFNKEIYSFGSHVELRKQKIIDPIVLTGQTASTAGQFVLDGTGFKLGIVEHKEIKTIEFEDPYDAYDGIWHVANSFGLEPRFRVENNGLKITDRYVDLVERRGRLSGKEVVFGKDIEGIERKETAGELVTALKVYGPIKTDGTRLTVIVEDEEAFQKWNVEGRHLWDKYEPQTDNQDITEAELSELGEKELSKRTTTQIQYNLKTIALEHVFGFEHEKVRLGDTNRVKDESKNPPIYLDARVISIKRGIKKKSRKEVEYGDFIEYTREQIQSEWKLLQARLQKRLAELKLIYTWVMYADDENGTGISDSPAGKSYIGFAYNKGTQTPSMNPDEYTWARIQGDQGVPGTPGEDGTPTFIWIKYADNASGSGMSDSPIGKTYIGIAPNKATATESTNAADYTWSLIKGDKGDTGPQGPQGNQGVPGPPGEDGQSLFTWVKYADNSSGGGMSDSPTGKTYIGLAYNKTTATESSTASDYTWSLIKGDTGAPGPAGDDGVTTYTWIKYADTETGSGMSDNPDGKRYLGLAYNKTTATESTNAADYSWSPLYDNVIPGVRNYYKNTDTTVSLLTGAATIVKNPADAPNGFKLTGVGVGSSIRLNNVINGNGEWTVSFNVKASAASNVVFDIADSASYNHNVTTVYQKVSFTRNVTNYSESLYHFVDISALDAVDYWFTDFKVEKGNVASDWSPAPEDVEEEIAQAQQGAIDYTDLTYAPTKDTVDAWRYFGTEELDGAKVKEKTIVTQKLLVTDFTNLCENPDFETDTVGSAPKGFTLIHPARVADISSFQNGNGSTKAFEIDARNGGNADVYATAVIPVSPGQQFFVEGESRYLNIAGTTGAAKILFRRYDATKTALNNWDPVVQWNTTKTSADQVFTKKNDVYTVPTACYYIQLLLSFTNNGETTNKAYFDNIRIHRMANAELIVDGSVKANHMEVGTITAASGIINDIDAGVITTGSLRVGAGQIALGTDFRGTFAPSTLGTPSAGLSVGTTHNASGSYLYLQQSGATEKTVAGKRFKVIPGATVTLTYEYYKDSNVTGGDVYVLSSTSEVSDSNLFSQQFNYNLFLATGATSGSWVKKTLTFTLPADARSAFIRYDHNGVNNATAGSIRYRNVMLNYGDISLQWQPHSDEDISIGAITADRLNVNSLSAITADLGTVTAGTIKGVTLQGNVLQFGTAAGRIEIKDQNGSTEGYIDNGVFDWSGDIRLSSDYAFETSHGGIGASVYGNTHRIYNTFGGVNYVLSKSDPSSEMPRQVHNFTGGDIVFGGNALISGTGGDTNNDHIWFDDTANEWHFVADGTYKQSGNAGLRANILRGPYGMMIKSVDSWLRINDDASKHTNGVYFGTSAIRTDGLIQVGNNGATFQASSSLLTYNGRNVIVDPSAGWIAPTMLNGVSNFGGGYESAGYYKDALGFIHLRGFLTGCADGKIAFTLPAGYRPSTRRVFTTYSNNTQNSSRVDIDTSGNVTLVVAGNWCLLDGIQFNT